MPCKPVTLCSSLLSSQKKKQRDAAIADVIEPVKRGKENGSVVVVKGAVDVVSLNRASSSTSSAAPTAAVEKGKPLRRSSSQVHREFLRATAGVSDGKLISFHDTLPSCEEAYAQFVESYPRFSETRALDHLRLQEYSHLEEEELACLDYCGFGLFSHAQQDDIAAEEEGFSSTFALSEISANLWSHALFGSAPEGTMECAIRARIMEFLNVPSSEYSMVFTASRGATFKLLADAYPWSSNTRLVTMYDYESESVGWMEQRSADSGARVYRARFRWPSLRVCSAELKKELMTGSGKKIKAKSKKQDTYQMSGPSSRLSVASWLDRVSLQQQHHKKEKKKGLFVFPVQSRVSGAKYSYQWMSLAQQNHWHVLLDASALGPKDMDSLGLSLFRPDFITASFYKLFGGDPSGFGCLLIKNSVAQSIQDPSGVPVSGMVRITPLPSQWAFSSSCTSEDSERYDEVRMISSFSGPMPAIDEIDIPTPPELEGSVADDNYSSACEDTELASVGDQSRSPVFSEDGHENPFSADAGPSPLGTASCASASEEGFSGPLREDPSHSTFQESHRLPGRRDGLPSKSRIKGLCSGLLHLHSGRVGNSGDCVGEDVRVLKDESRDFFEDRKVNSVKHVAFQSKDVLDQGKPARNGAFMSRMQLSRHDSAESGEQIPERLVLVLKKIREEQLALGNGELSLCSQIREHERKSLTRRANDILHHGEEEEFMDRVHHGGLETIEEIEIEAERPKSLERSELEAVHTRLSEANNSKLSRLEKTEQGMGLQTESAICRETEGGFRLLGCRNADPFSLGRVFSAGPGDDSFHSRSIGSGGREFSSMERSIGSRSDEEPVEVDEPQLLCRSLDHADMMGLNKTSVRLRYLINWLVSSLLTLRHPESDLSLVRIYGPQVRYDRGASVAFNLLDSQGKLLQPDLVRMLADQVNISLGLGYLRNIFFRGNFLEAPALLSGSSTSRASSKVATVPSRVEVVTAALGLLSDFRDVYKLWSFLAKFLNPDFVRSEVGSLQPSSSRHGA